MQWSIAAASAIHVRCWDDDASGLAFDERSGDTFVLSALALELLSLLRERGVCAADVLAGQLAQELGSLAPASLATDVEVELLRLSSRSLVETVPSS
ncbi:hypothetical protein CLD22_00280 [Rubrivivax gelatinosus]|nr:hypothetical protein [Rubrivivax gelatinosus]